MNEILMKEVEEKLNSLIDSERNPCISKFYQMDSNFWKKGESIKEQIRISLRETETIN